MKIKALLHTNYNCSLLVFFFVLHQWNEFYNLVSFYDVLKFFFLLFLFVFLYFHISYFIIRDKIKAAVFTILSNFLFLFYGGVSFFLTSKVKLLSSGLSCVLLVLFLILTFFLLIKHSKLKWSKLSAYFSSLFIILFALELVFFIEHTTVRRNNFENNFLRLQEKSITKKNLSSVFLILLDEYAGSETLQKYNFSNEHFIKGMSDEGFRIIKKAQSNYSSTVPSIASLLNCNYTNSFFSANPYSSEGYINSLNEIKNNQVAAVFKDLGYDVKNYSPFPMDAAGKVFNNRFIPAEISLLFSSTIFDDLIELTPLFIARRINNEKMLKRLIASKTNSNYEIMNSVANEADNKRREPVFCYAHLMMPHSPFAKDSLGHINSAFFRKSPLTQADKNGAYLQYLKYTNVVILDFVKRIKSMTKGQAVIILMSDHGSRDLATGLSDDESFNSLNCIYMPNGDTSGWYEGISNVNQFRVLFSTLLRTSVPLLRDSIVRNE